MKKSYHSYWAKSHKTTDGEPLKYHLLPYHLLDVAAVAWVLLERDSRLCSRLAQMAGMDAHNFRVWFTFLMGLHDVGKFSPRFQALDKRVVAELEGVIDTKPYTIRHDTLGWFLFKDVLRDKLTPENSIFGKIIQEKSWTKMKVWADAVMGHHGKPPESDKKGSDDFFCADSKKASSLFSEDWGNFIGKDLTNDYVTFETKKEFSWLYAGLAVLCDWIGSSEDFFKYHSDIKSLEEYWRVALESAEIAMQEISIIPATAREETSFEELFPFIAMPTNLQEWASTVRIPVHPSLTIIEDIPGSGKTEAAMMLVHRMISQGIADGVYFALPTMATSNQMYDRLSKKSTVGQEPYRMLFAEGETPSLVLAHAHAKLNEDYKYSLFSSKTNSRENNYSKDDASITAECNAWFADSRKKCFLADVAVGTIDQVLLGVLPSKHQSLRLIGLFRKVLLVDEVHANDPYMHEVLCEALRFHASFGGSVILLSATLPDKMKQELLNAYNQGLAGDRSEFPQNFNLGKEYPMASVYANGVLESKALESRKDLQRTIQVKFLNTLEEVTALIQEVSVKGKCIGWIRNTVTDAMDGYNKLKKPEIPSDRLHLFHARFAMGDRLDIEKNVLKWFGKESNHTSRKGRVLVATQVVEQSLDLDFDVLITDLAPMDSIIQRMGRLQRHKRDLDGNPVSSQADKDQREDRILYVFAAEMPNETKSNWYSQLFPGGAFVYPDHTLLWRTAALLAENNKITMPDDARDYILNAFDKNKTRIDVPEALEKSSDKAHSEEMSHRLIGNMNTLKFEEGYIITESTWLPDTVTPTRLGDKSVTLRLAKYDGTTITAWSENTSNPWAMSDAGIAYRSVAKECEWTQELQQVEHIKDTMPDKGKYSVLVLLKEQEDRKWHGKAVNEQDKIVTVEYDFESGLIIVKD